MCLPREMSQLGRPLKTLAGRGYARSKSKRAARARGSARPGLHVRAGVKSRGGLLAVRRITFNEVMLESVKNRSSIKMKDIFKLIVNETYEGGERRLDGKFAFPASRLVTPNGHPNVSVDANAKRVTHVSLG